MRTQTRCPVCDEPLSAGICLRCDADSVTRLAHHQILKLAALVVVSIALMVFTRDVAARLNTARTQDAAMWFDRGQESLAADDVNGAVDAFRKAAAAQTDNADYQLGLAEALVAAQRNDEALGLLTQMRAQAPENALVNMYLARLAVGRSSLEDAVRYYRNALQGIWPAGRQSEQRDLRLELIDLLLAHGDREGALSEILVLSTNSAGETDFDARVGRLFLDAGAPNEAWDTFYRILDAEPENRSALVGAGDAQFALGDYGRARRYLRAAIAQGVDAPEVKERLDVANLVLTADPTAPRLSTDERLRRLRIVVDRLIERTQACLTGDADRSDVTGILDEATALRTRLRPGAVRREPDLPDTGLDLVARLDSAAGSCPASTALDQALELMERRRRTSES